MKINKIIATCLIGVLLITSSCSDFLDQGSESKIPDGDRLFGDFKTSDAYVVGLYRSWREGHKGRVDMFLGTDEGIVGGFQHDDYERRGLEEYSEGQNSTNGKVRNIWTNRYEVIARANKAIPEFKKRQDMPGYKNLLGECCLLRAENLWELTLLFGPVLVYDDENPDLVRARQPLNVVYDRIEKDLLMAEECLSNIDDVKDDLRVSKVLAQALLGKMYLHAPESSGYKNYAKAAEYFKKVVDNPYFGGTGAPNYAAIFDSENQESGDYTKEIVYDFKYKAGSPNNNGIEWELGSRAVAQMTANEAIAPWSGFDGMLPSEYCYKMQTDGGLWEDGDVRREESIRFDFSWNGITPNMNGWVWGDELEPHIKKYEDMRTVKTGQNTWHSGKNVPFIRFSDVVLNYAECLYFTGKKAEAINLINNIVRKRAFGGTLPADKAWSTGLSEADFMKNLMDERMRELCFEGWRKFDLLRTGLLKEYVPKRNRWHIGGTWTNKFGTQKKLAAVPAIQDFRFLWPIPLDELKQNPYLTESDQNPGYSD